MSKFVVAPHFRLLDLVCVDSGSHPMAQKSALGNHGDPRYWPIPVLPRTR
jgi:hypothetical protein